MPRWRSRRTIVGIVLAAIVLAGLGIGLHLYLRTGGKRVLAVGDSLTVQSMSAIKSDLGDHGFDVSVVAIGGSGLLDTKTNWPDRLRSQISSLDPDEVVVEFIGNYGLFGVRPGVVDGSPQFYQQWAAEAQNGQNILSSRGAVVYWVLGPPVRDPVQNQRVMNLSEIYRNLRAPRVLPFVPSHPPTIDMFKPFSNSDGSYTDFGLATNGKVEQLRSSDGTHFTLAGALLFAQTISNGVVNGPKRHVLGR